jgi:hypothetical protein
MLGMATFDYHWSRHHDSLEAGHPGVIRGRAPRRIRLHAALAKVIHTADMAEHLENILRDYESICVYQTSRMLNISMAEMPHCTRVVLLTLLLWRSGLRFWHHRQCTGWFAVYLLALVPVLFGALRVFGTWGESLLRQGEGDLFERARSLASTFKQVLIPLPLMLCSFIWI